MSKSTIEITNVQIFPLKESESKLRAFARVLLNDELQLTGLRIYEGSDGLFVAYPNDPAYKEDYRQMFYPITRDLRDNIETACVDKYNKSIKGDN